MVQRHPNKGPWTHRFLVGTFTVALTLLTYWLLGFVINDIGTWPGPDYTDVEQWLLNPELLCQAEELQVQIADSKRKIKELKARQRIVQDSTTNSQRTMNQLIEIRRLSLQKDVAPSAEEQKALADSEQLFLVNQNQYQLLNEQIASLDEKLRELEKKDRELKQTLAKERGPVQEEFQSLYRWHELKMAALKLAVLVPLLVVAVVLFLKKRNSTYVSLIYAFGIALALKVLQVMHEHFSERYFKYILILASLAVVARILSYLLRMIAFPGKEWLLKQYREAYETFLCPICSYPIRRGPLKYLFWSRRSIKKLRLVASFPTDQPDEPYTCPMCGTRLFEECDACHTIRHSLLPACQGCGAEKTLESIIEPTADQPPDALEQTS